MMCGAQTYVDERARFVDDPRFRLYTQRLRMRMQSEPDSTDASYYLDGVRRRRRLSLSLSLPSRSRSPALRPCDDEL